MRGRPALRAEVTEPTGRRSSVRVTWSEPAAGVVVLVDLEAPTLARADRLIDAIVPLDEATWQAQRQPCDPTLGPPPTC